MKNEKQTDEQTKKLTDLKTNKNPKGGPHFPVWDGLDLKSNETRQTDTYRQVMNKIGAI